MKGKKFNLPNILSLVRLGSIPLIVVLFLINNTFLNYALFFIFLFIQLTDVLDGYIARKKKQVTAFGAFLDPFVDKLLIHIFFILFAVRGILPVYLVIIIFARDLLVNAVRSLAKAKNVILPCPWTSKLKAVLQVIVVGFGLFFIAVSPILNDFILNIFSKTVVILMWITVIFSLYVLYDFFAVKRNRNIVFDES